MKRILLACMLLMLASSLTNVMAQTAKKPISKQGLVNAVRIFFDAVKTNDLVKVKAYYSDDYTFTGSDGKMVTAEERLAALKDQAGIFVRASEINTRVYGDAAVVTGVVTNKTATGGVEQLQFLQVWAMQGPSLHLVATQVTKIE